MKASAALLAILLIGLVGVAGYFVYQTFSTKVSVETSAPNIPSFVDVDFYVGSEGNRVLPTKFLDLTKEFYEFPMGIRNLFDEKVKVKVCPKIVVSLLDSTSSIDVECLEFELNPGEKKEFNTKIPIQGRKGELKKSTRTALKIEVEHTGIIKSLCDLYLTRGYPYCKTSKTSSIEIRPDIKPNPIDLARDEEFSVHLGIKKFSEFLKLEKAEIIPIETRVRTISFGREKIETITLEESFSSSLSYIVSMPEDYMFLNKFSAPKIKVEEAGRKEYININCEAELARKLKICELKDKDRDVEESFKKLLLEIKVGFLSERSTEYSLFVSK